MAAGMLHRAATVAAVMVGTGAGRPLRPLTIHLDFGIVEFALLGQAGEVDTRDELVREEKRYRFSEARMEPSTFDTHNCDASRRGASLTAKDLADIGPGFWSFRLRFRLGSSRAVENRPTQAKNVPAGSIGNY